MGFYNFLILFIKKGSALPNSTPPPPLSDPQRQHRAAQDLLSGLHRLLSTCLTAPQHCKVGHTAPQHCKVGHTAPKHCKVGYTAPQRCKVGQTAPERCKVGQTAPQRCKVGQGALTSIAPPLTPRPFKAVLHWGSFAARLSTPAQRSAG